MSLLPLTGAGPSAGSYIAKVLGYSPIAYWPLNETTGSTANCLVNSAQDGTYTGVTLANASGPDGRPCPLFDGINDHVDVYSAALNGIWDGDECTIALWCKAFNAAVWADASYRRSCLFQEDADNFGQILRDGGNNGAMMVQYRGSATSKTVSNIATGSTLDWFHMAITITTSGNQVKAYLNGSQSGGTQTGIPAYVGALSNTDTTIGSNGVAGGSRWKGWMAHPAVFPLLNATQIADLAVA